MEKEEKKKQYEAGQVVTGTAPSVIDPQGKALTIEEALCEIINDIKDIKQTLHD